jgi:hypothetical protein
VASNSCESATTKDGLLFCSTPYPAATAHRRAINDPTLQIIDEQVELSDIVVEARAAGLQLLRYEAFDVFAGSPEYQPLSSLMPAHFADRQHFEHRPFNAVEP